MSGAGPAAVVLGVVVDAEVEARHVGRKPADRLLFLIDGFSGLHLLTLLLSCIVETGTFLGYGTIALAQGLKSNGFGRVITIEPDPLICAKAKERIKAAGLTVWVESRNESSAETTIDGRIDLLFSDSAIVVREQEVRRLSSDQCSRLDRNSRCQFAFQDCS